MSGLVIVAVVSFCLGAIFGMTVMALVQVTRVSPKAKEEQEGEPCTQTIS